MPKGAAPPQGKLERAVMTVFADTLAARDMTKAELARRSDVSEGQLYDLFNGNKTLRWFEFEAICEALGVDPATVTAVAVGRVHQARQGDAEQS